LGGSTSASQQGWSISSERRSLAMLPGCPSSNNRIPPQFFPCPHRRLTTHEIQVPLLEKESIHVVSNREKKLMLEIEDIVDILQGNFAMISGTFCIQSLKKHHEICQYSPDDIIDP
jgi:hypothetical protein